MIFEDFSVFLSFKFHVPYVFFFFTIFMFRYIFFATTGHYVKKGFFGSKYSLSSTVQNCLPPFILGLCFVYLVILLVFSVPDWCRLYIAI